MIGRIEFDGGAAGTITATLEDDQTWTCDDPVALRDLTDRAIPADGYLPPQEQLCAASFLPGYRILEQRPVAKPDPDVVY